MHLNASYYTLRGPSASSTMLISPSWLSVSCVNHPPSFLNPMDSRWSTAYCTRLLDGWGGRDGYTDDAVCCWLPFGGETKLFTSIESLSWSRGPLGVIGTSRRSSSRGTIPCDTGFGTTGTRRRWCWHVGVRRGFGGICSCFFRIRGFCLVCLSYLIYWNSYCCK